MGTDPVFSQMWWLDAVASGQWRDVVVSQGPDTEARLVYVPKKRLGVLTALVSPPYSPRLGPLLTIPDHLDSTEWHDTRISLLNKLVANIPEHDIFGQNCAPGFDFWSPFHWAGYDQTTYYSYIIDDPADEDGMWSRMSAQHQTRIEQASERFTLADDLPTQTMLDLYTATFARQDLDVPFDPEITRRAIDAARDHDTGRLVVALDQAGKPVAGIMFVWDDDRYYYLIGGRADGGDIDGVPMVMWEGMRTAHKTSQKFDFQGAMIQRIDEFYRGFGGRPEPYSHLRRDSKRSQALRLARETVGLTGQALKTKAREL